MLSRASGICTGFCDIVIGLGGECVCPKDTKNLNLNDYLTTMENLQKTLARITGTTKGEEPPVVVEKRRRSRSPLSSPRVRRRSRSPVVKKKRVVPGDVTKTLYVRYIGKVIPGPFDTLDKQKTESWRLGSQIFSRYGVVISCYVWEFKRKDQMIPMASVTFKETFERDDALKDADTIASKWGLRIYENKFDE